MNISGKITKKIDTKVLLSTLWIVVMINMLKADILSLYIPGAADEVARTAGETPITQLMLGGASPDPHYIFIAAVETICLLLIIWNAWRWSAQEA